MSSRADLKVDNTIPVHVSIDRFSMGQPKRTKGKNAKVCETSRREEGDTARAGEADEPSTSQEHEDPVNAGVSGDDDTSTQQLNKPFTDQQDKQIAAFFAKHPMFYDRTHPDYKNKKKRDFLTKQFAQSMFTSGKCVLSFKSSAWTIPRKTLNQRAIILHSPIHTSVAYHHVV